MAETGETIEELVPILKRHPTKETVLFLGAGASKTCGLPTTKELVSEIKNAFKRLKIEEDDLFKVANAIDVSGDRGLIELVEFLTKRLSVRNVSESFKKIVEIPLGGIITTNYDEALETAHEDNLEKAVQRIKPVAGKFVQFERDPDILHLFKLMGTINPKSPDEHCVLTTTQLYDNFRVREEIFNQIVELIKTKLIVVCGYSFEDYLFLDIIQRFKAIESPHSLPRIYYVVKDTAGKKDWIQHLGKTNIRTYEGTFEVLIDILYSLKDDEIKPIIGRPGEKANIFGENIIIENDDLRRISHLGSLLTHTFLERRGIYSETKIKDFLEGYDADWSPYVREWDFRRKSIENEIKAYIDKQINEMEFESYFSSTILIKGQSGSGKSVLLKRIALEIYLKRKFPVIFVDPESTTIDHRAIESTLKNLYGIEPIRVLDKPKFLILCVDDAADKVRQMHNLSNYLNNRGIHVVLLLSSRTNDWAIGFEEQHYRPDFEVDLDRKLISEEDILLLIEKYQDLKVIKLDTPSRILLNIFEEELGKSFFAALYRLVTYAQEPLENGLINEYSKLSDLQKRIYKYIAIIHQYGAQVNIEWLFRTLNIGYAEGTEVLFSPELKGLIYEEPTPYTTILVRTRHRIVAEILLDKLFGGQYSDEYINLLTEYISNARPTEKLEAKIIRNILISKFGHKGSVLGFAFERIKKLFSKAISVVADTAILHHYGILLNDNGEHAEAVITLKNAVTLHESEDPTVYRTESIYNIYNSLGVAYHSIAEMAEKEGDEKLAEVSYDEADFYFDKAAKLSATNSYAHHAKANMYFKRGERNEKKGDLVNSSKYFIKALDIVEKAFEYVDDSFNVDLLYDLRDRNLVKLKDEGLFRKFHEGLQKNGVETDESLYLKAYFNYFTAENKNEPSLLKSVNTTLDEALNKKENIKSLRLKTTVLKKADPNNIEDIYNILKRRYAFPEEKTIFRLLYLYGYYSFRKGNYAESKKVFDELEDYSIGHNKRNRILDIFAVDGKKEFFVGDVVYIENRYRGYLKSRKLSNVFGDIKFIPVAQRSSINAGDNVRFLIGFNYRGILATNLEKN